MYHQTSPTGTLISILINIDEMKTFEFLDFTEVLVVIWRHESNPYKRSLIDFIIILAINQKELKGITRMQYIELSWLIIPAKAKRACKEMETGNGPVTIRTPFGLGAEEWAEGLEKYAKEGTNKQTKNKRTRRQRDYGANRKKKKLLVVS